MVFPASRIRGIFGGGVSPLLIAGILAVSLGFPSAAEATFLHPSEISPGDFNAGGSFPSCEDDLTLRDFHDLFVERAAHQVDFHHLLSPLDDFQHHPLHPPFDDLEKPSWSHGVLGGGPGWIGADLDPRPLCRFHHPQVIPEPGTGLLLMGGLIGLAFAGRRRLL